MKKMREITNPFTNPASLNTIRAPREESLLDSQRQQSKEKKGGPQIHLLTIIR